MGNENNECKSVSEFIEKFAPLHDEWKNQHFKI